MRTLRVFFLLAIMTTACEVSTVEDLVQTDMDFSRRSEEVGMKQAFLEYASDTAVMFPRNALPLVGKTAIRKSFETLNDSGFILTWEPMAGDISRKGDLGYTYGLYTMYVKSSGDSLRGKYCSIWKKQQDGSFKWVIDVGNEGIE